MTHYLSMKTKKTGCGLDLDGEGMIYSKQVSKITCKQCKKLLTQIKDQSRLDYVLPK